MLAGSLTALSTRRDASRQTYLPYVPAPVAPPRDDGPRVIDRRHAPAGRRTQARVIILKHFGLPHHLTWSRVTEEEDEEQRCGPKRRGSPATAASFESETSRARRRGAKRRGLGTWRAPRRTQVDRCSHVETGPGRTLARLWGLACRLARPNSRGCPYLPAASKNRSCVS